MPPKKDIPSSSSDDDDYDEEFVEKTGNYETNDVIRQVYGEKVVKNGIIYPTIWDAYDVLTDNEVTYNSEVHKKSMEQDVGYGQYDFRDVVFSAPIFDKFRAKENLYIEKLRAGPKLQEGIQPCISKECRLLPNRVISVEKQVASADEPSTFFHSCQRCGANWRTRG